MMVDCLIVYSGLYDVLFCFFFFYPFTQSFPDAMITVIRLFTVIYCVQARILKEMQFSIYLHSKINCFLHNYK